MIIAVYYCDIAYACLRVVGHAFSIIVDSNICDKLFTNHTHLAYLYAVTVNHWVGGSSPSRGAIHRAAYSNVSGLSFVYYLACCLLSAGYIVDIFRRRG